MTILKTSYFADSYESLAFLIQEFILARILRIGFVLSVGFSRIIFRKESLVAELSPNKVFSQIVLS